MRNAFADEMTKLSIKHNKVVMLSGDIGNRLFDKFKDANPDRFMNCGIAEANMVGLAAGMALIGLRPFIYTITPFTTTRCLEQIKLDACYHKLPVVIVGTGSGLSYAELGATHHSCEDLAILRVFPEISVLAPADEVELRQALRAVLKLDGPVYIRIGKKGEKILPKKNDDFTIGRSITVRDGKDVCLIGTGTIMPEILGAAEALSNNGISCRVESCHTIKPLDNIMLDEVFDKFSLIGVAEEHYKVGGLFSAIAESYISKKTKNVRFLGFGVPDQFIHEVGTQEYVRERFGLTAKAIAKEVLRTFDN